jgi:tetratricopeptide (TPR) repeat protein
VNQPRSLQDIVRSRQGAGFVGRQGELALFAQNLALPLDDEARRFVFNVHGDGGVGKSHLLRRLVQIAAGAGAACADTDEHVVGVPETMARISARLAAAGEELRDFDKRYEAYSRHRDQVAQDPQAPREAWSLVTRTVVKAGLHASKAVPGARPFVDLIDADAAADATDRFRRYLGGKFGDSRAVQLLLDPVAELTPVFVRGLGEVAARRPVALFFDTYEETGRYLDGWLLQLLRGEFGGLPASIVLTVAGRHPLDPSGWSDFLGIVAPVPLRPFTDTEARQFLAGRGIVAEPVIDTVLALSGRLPLLVALLAENLPDDLSELGDPSGTAVGRFLRWEHDKDRKKAAVLGALPRAVDEDLLAAVTGADQAADLFAWLRGMPFVSARAGRYRYHEVVRDAMLRARRAESPQQWREAHQRLAAAHHRWAAESSPATESTRSPVGSWFDETWRAHRIEEVYHALCAAPSALAEPLTAAVGAADEGRVTARRFAEMVRDAGRDAGADRLRELGDRLLAAVAAESADTAEFLTLLLRQPALPAAAAVEALVERGYDHFLADRDDLAEADADEALRRDPDHVRAHVLRGSVLCWNGRPEAALPELTRAIELDPRNRSARGYRGRAYRVLRRFEEAAADLDRAIELDPDDAWALGERALVRILTDRYDAALADLTRAIEASGEPRPGDSDPQWALGLLGHVCRVLQRYEEAVAHLTRAVALDAGDALSWCELGMARAGLGRWEEALADLGRAVELDPEYATSRAWRGRAYHALARLDEALAELGRAVELSPDYAWAWQRRGVVRQDLGRDEEAGPDLRRAVELWGDVAEPDAWTLSQRGEALRLLGRHEEALADLDRAVDRDPDAWRLGTRGQVLRSLGRHEDALADLDRALACPDAGSEGWLRPERAQVLRSLGRYDEVVTELTHRLAEHPDDTSALGLRAVSLRRLGRHQEALADLGRMIELDASDRWACTERGETFRLMERFDEALVELDRALELDPDDAWTIGTRAQVLAEFGRYEESVVELDRALARADAGDEDWLRSARGTVLRVLGRYDAAIADLTRAIELDPDEGWSYGQRAWAYRGSGRDELVEADLAAAERLEPAEDWRTSAPTPGVSG